jgi:hypothetical protein
MLRKILTTLVIIGLAVTIGCKKAETPAPEAPAAPQVQIDVNAK